jgi:SAM-dependent methyltransferase
MCDGSVDIIVSTLMMAHVREIKDELSEWVRLLNAKGEVILTDFHPEALRAGMRTTFAHRGATFEIKNHPRSVLSLHTLFQKLRLDVLAREEGSLDVNVRDTYERHGRMDIYRKHFGIPMIIAFRLRKAE